jgi:hypothetical protein
MQTHNATGYYNAKPSNITNLGKDVSGAKRMNFDTYESSEQKETRKRKNASDRKLKEELKAAILSAFPNSALVSQLLCQQFESDFGFSCKADNAHSIMLDRRALAVDKETRSVFNKMVRSFYRTRKTLSRIESEYYFSRYLESARKKYAPKQSFVGQSGTRFSWKEFEQVTPIEGNLEFLKANTSAVQFGNSVSDKERAYIVRELAKFIQEWKACPITMRASISAVSWSFGARGNAQSVAFFQPGQKVISVNRDNIGSLVHELGHFLDDKAGNISRKISWGTVQAYDKTLPEYIQGNERRYYCSKVEIFARAFEAYCLSKQTGFGQFAQCGKAFLPELNEELIALVESVLK